MKIAYCVPVRMGSTRFPGKPLAPLGGLPLFWYATDSVPSSEVGNSFVLWTEEDKLAYHGMAYETDWKTIWTPAYCRNGTERAAWFSAREEGSRYDAFINIQCDEVGLLAKDVQRLAWEVEENPQWVHTLYFNTEEPLGGVYANFGSTGVVRKWGRSDNIEAGHHVGVYGYSKELLKRYAETEPSYEEIRDSLEQWRWKLLKVMVKVHRIDHPTVSVNEPSDVARAEELLLQQASQLKPTSPS